LPYDPAQGHLNLAACSNISISDSGKRISRRKGNRRIVTSSANSLFPLPDKLLFVSGGKIKALSTDLSTVTDIVTVSTWPASFCQIADTTYWVNGNEAGKIIGTTNYDWKKPTGYTDRKDPTKVYSDPPPGVKIAYYRGRIYIADHNVVWVSEPYAPNLFMLKMNLQFETGVIMVRPVASGLFISDNDKTWFLRGTGPNDFAYDVALGRPAILHSDSPVNGAMITNQSGGVSVAGGNDAALWLNDEGFCWGNPDGSIVEFTKERFIPPDGVRGATHYDDNKIIGRWY